MLLFFRQCWHPPKIKQQPIESQFVDILRHSQIQLIDDSIKSCFNQEVKMEYRKTNWYHNPWEWRRLLDEERIIYYINKLGVLIAKSYRLMQW